MSPLLEVNNMTHYFGGLRAVHNYNLNLVPQQITGLIGPNGAGKSTMLEMLTGLLRPSAGQIQILGKPARGGSRGRQCNIGLHPQGPS